MKKQVVFLFVIFLFAFNNKAKAFTEPVVPDTVKVGVYFISLHDIDFRQRNILLGFGYGLGAKKLNTILLKM